MSSPLSFPLPQDCLSMDESKSDLSESPNMRINALKSNTQPDYSQETQETQQSQLKDVESQDTQSETQKNCWGTLIQVDGDRMELTNKNYTYSVGRLSVCDLTISQPGISGTHFEIELDEGKRRALPMIKDLSSFGTFLNGILIGKGKQRCLKQLDKITLIDSASKEFVFYFKDHSTASSASQLPSPTFDAELIQKGYHIIGDLGCGNSSSVKLAVCKESTITYAIKIISKLTLSEQDIQQMRKEVEILQDLKHERIIEISDFFETIQWMYIVLEYAKEGDLMKFIHRNHSSGLPEELATLIFIQVVEAMEYLHQKHVLHRDLKAENILIFERGEEGYRVKVSDFGLAISTRDRTHTVCGTPQYIAPEIYNDKKGYGKEVDMWSAGVLLYFLLSGSFPFSEDNFYSVRDKVMAGIIDSIPSTTPEVITMIRSLLDINPSQRWTATQTLNHLRKYLSNKHTKNINHNNGLINSSITKKRSQAPPLDEEDTKPRKIRKTSEVINIT